MYSQIHYVREGQSDKTRNALQDKDGQENILLLCIHRHTTNIKVLVI